MTGPTSATRRQTLTWTANPSDRMEYIVTLSGSLAIEAVSKKVALKIRYVPDKSVLERTAFEGYLRVLEETAWSNLEDLAAAVLDDMNNEIITRWIQIELTTEGTAPKADGGEMEFGDYTVLIEDRQPKWDNAVLLSRI